MGTREMLQASARAGRPSLSFSFDGTAGWDSAPEAQKADIVQGMIDSPEDERTAYATEALRRLRAQAERNSASPERAREKSASPKQNSYVDDLARRLAASRLAEFAEIGAKATDWNARVREHYGFYPARLVSPSIDRLRAHVVRMETAERMALVADELPPTVAGYASAVEPVRASAPEVEPGRYALRGEDGVVRFYRVKESKQGRTYVMIQASDELHLVHWYRGGRDVVEAIAKDPAAAHELYGQELGHCWKCGRTLTDQTSRDLGIGPDCRSKLS
jgi:hypothetical protein